uniref:Uncharacterized protein n=1 Tax=Lepeophtheirus salmonis TaxID=72036 RepID=A0A0K2U2P4_LEPSM
MRVLRCGFKEIPAFFDIFIIVLREIDLTSLTDDSIPFSNRAGRITLTVFSAELTPISTILMHIFERAVAALTAAARTVSFISSITRNRSFHKEGI